jgi:RimJ/RimL family protein N-acetyltransferase
MIFQSARLIARRMESGDLAAFAAYRNDPDAARYQSWTSFSLEEAGEFIASMALKNPGDSGWFQFALQRRDDSSLVGDCGLRIIEDDRRLAEIGFTVARQHWNKGYASEEVRALVDYAFNTFGLHRITASADPRNTASCRVLEKAGMHKEAHHRQSLWFKGEWADDAVYAILRGEWKPG